MIIADEVNQNKSMIKGTYGQLVDAYGKPNEGNPGVLLQLVGDKHHPWGTGTRLTTLSPQIQESFKTFETRRIEACDQFGVKGKGKDYEFPEAGSYEACLAAIEEIKNTEFQWVEKPFKFEDFQPRDIHAPRLPAPIEMAMLLGWFLIVEPQPEEDALDSDIVEEKEGSEEAASAATNGQPRRGFRTPPKSKK